MNLNIKYRPRTFEEICGQTVTVAVLKKIIETGTYRNCYLFAGKTGAGKTTAARCFARAINNGIGDPIEIDAASNGSVDSIRAIVESANQRALVGTYKIFIIDECHSISTTGWQAFLKCIEEAPTYTIFIFCTTEVNKVPQTILNRVQRYNFAPISAKDIYNRLVYICEQEHFTNYEQTCDFISKICNGCMRDAITLLEQCADYSKDLKLEIIKGILGSISYETMFKLTWAIQHKQEKDILAIIDKLVADGQDVKNFISIYTDFVLDLYKYSLFKTIDVTTIPAYLATPENAVVQFTVEQPNSVEVLSGLSNMLLELKTNLKYDLSNKTTAEISLIKFARNEVK